MLRRSKRRWSITHSSAVTRSQLAFVLPFLFVVSALSFQTPDRTAEARKHFQIAVVALQNNDLQTAQEELKKSAELSPRNSLVFYNLAVVESKLGDIHGADASLTKAERLRIPIRERQDAEKLRAEIDYALGTEKKQVAAVAAKHEEADAMTWLVGRWETKEKDEESGCTYSTSSNNLLIDRAGDSFVGTLQQLHNIRVGGTRTCPTDHHELEGGDSRWAVKDIQPWPGDNEYAALTLSFNGCEGKLCTHFPPGLTLLFKVKRTGEGEIGVQSVVGGSTAPVVIYTRQ